MGLENTRNKKLLYHLTDLKNMTSIIKNGLLSRSDVISKGIIYSDVADSEIVTRRQMLGLDKYIPFHFHPYSAFDVAVKKSHPENEFVYVTIRRDLAVLAGFKVLIKHPLSQDECVLYDYKDGISKIDWDTMEQAGLDDPYSKNVKMAECLSDRPIPASLIQCVYVPDEFKREYVEQLFWDHGITEQPPYVSVMEKFF